MTVQWAKTNPWNPVLQGQDYCQRCWLFYLLSSRWSVFVSVLWPILLFQWKEKHRRKYCDRGDRGPQWCSDLKRGEIIPNDITHTHTHQLHCPQSYSSYTIVRRILLHYAVFSLCGLKPAELTKAKAQGSLGFRVQNVSDQAKWRTSRPQYLKV